MEEYIETSSGNRILKQAKIYGPDRILISGNTTIKCNVELHGDVEALDEKSKCSIQIGKYCYLDSDCQVEPPTMSNGIRNPVVIGSYTIIGKNSVIRLMNIGNRVLIERNCKLNEQSVVYDCCWIREGTIIPPKMVIPPYSEVRGVPGVDFEITDLSNSYKKLIEHEAKQLQLLE